MHPVIMRTHKHNSERFLNFALLYSRCIVFEEAKITRRESIKFCEGRLTVFFIIMESIRSLKSLRR